MANKSNILDHLSSTAASTRNEEFVKGSCFSNFGFVITFVSLKSSDESKSLSDFFEFEEELLSISSDDIDYSGALFLS